MDPILRGENLHLSFHGIHAVQGVDFDVAPGEIFGIIGPNGAGKTSVLNCINGFYHPQQGRIIFEGRDISRIPPHTRAHLGIARTFQNIALYPGMTVLDNIMTGRVIRMRSGGLACGVYRGPAEREQVRNRRIVEEIIDFLESSTDSDVTRVLQHDEQKHDHRNERGQAEIHFLASHRRSGRAGSVTRPSSIRPRQAPVSRPRLSMNSLNRWRSPSTRFDTTPSQSPAFSTAPSGS